MSSIGSTSLESGGKSTPPQVEDLITTTLPAEVLQNIFSYLNGLDLQSASAVSRLWGEVTIDAKKHNDLNFGFNRLETR